MSTASVSSSASSGGSLVVGSGGLEDSLTALMTLLPERFSFISEIHSVERLSALALVNSLRFSSIARVSSSCLISSAALSTDRKSLREASGAIRVASSARSFHVASFRAGNMGSAIASKADSGTVGLPSAIAFSFWTARACLTAGIPPFSSCSAIGKCSGAMLSSALARWVFLGVNFLNLTGAALGICRLWDFRSCGSCPGFLSALFCDGSVDPEVVR